jgi:hypothetical protein
MILLSSFIKMQHLYPELLGAFTAVFDSTADSIDAEVRTSVAQSCL